MQDATLYLIIKSLQKRGIEQINYMTLYYDYYPHSFAYYQEQLHELLGEGFINIRQKMTNRNLKSKDNKTVIINNFKNFNT